MPRFFVPRSQIYDREIVILGEDAKHIITSLRLREGDIITVCDMQKTDYDCTISSVFDGIVRAEIDSGEPTRSEFPFRIRIFLPMPKADTLDAITEAAVRMGASELIPVTNVPPSFKSDRGKEQKRLERARKTAVDTAGNCLRGVIPTVGNPVSLETALEMAKEDDLFFYCSEEACEKTMRDFERISRNQSGIRSLSFFFDSEDGFKKSGRELARESGIPFYSMGSRLLPAELAVAFVLSSLSLTFEL